MNSWNLCLTVFSSDSLRFVLTFYYLIGQYGKVQTGEEVHIMTIPMQNDWCGERQVMLVGMIEVPLGILF